MTALPVEEWRHGRIRQPALEALGRHGSAATCTGNGWREMAAGTVRQCATRIPGGGAEHSRAAMGFKHGRSSAGRVVAASDRLCRRFYGAGAWQRYPGQAEGGVARGARWRRGSDAWALAWKGGD
jgi:hypothetical protein